MDIRGARSEEQRGETILNTAASMLGEASVTPSGLNEPSPQGATT